MADDAQDRHDEQGEHDELARLILRYLAAHPQAADSLEGICDWWIPMQRLHEARHKVRSALDALVRNGQLVAQQGADGRTLYSAPSLPSPTEPKTQDGRFSPSPGSGVA